jgi:hypothetical protein
MAHSPDMKYITWDLKCVLIVVDNDKLVTTPKLLMMKAGSDLIMIMEGIGMLPP